MELKEIEVYSDASNFGVVRMPGRHYPGCVIQGDSLCALLHQIHEVRDIAQSLGHQVLIESVDDIESLVADRLNHYETILAAHEIELPYVR